MVVKPVRVLVFLMFPVFLFFLSTQVKGQGRDAGLWTSFSFEAKIIKRVSASIAQEFRFNENITELGTVFTDAGISYKVNKHFQVAANYRFIRKRSTEDFYNTRHRFYVDVKYSKKIKPFEVSLRSRFQDQYSDIGRAPDGGIPGYYFRNKLSLDWNTKTAFSPYLSVELFSPLKYPRSIAFDNIRATAGVDYAFSKHHKIDLFYMIQKELNVSRPATDFILGLGYSYKL